MSSGFGLRGGISRCYPFFAEYKECLKHEPSRKGELCHPLRDDYFECLHKRKEHGMIRTIKEQEQRNMNGDLNEDHGHGH